MTTVARRVMTTVPAGSFSPTEIPGLRIWLDASTLALADNAPVMTWPDLSPTGTRTATAPNSTEAPTFKPGIRNGLGVVRFSDPARSNMTFNPLNPMEGATAGTAFTVHASANDPPVGSPGALLQAWGNESPADHQPFSDGTIYHGWGSTTRYMVGNPAPSLAAFRDHVIVSAPGNWRYLLDGGAPIYSTATNTVTFPNSGSTGLAAYARPWAGDAAEIVAYSRALTTAVNQVGDYLAAKWGLTWTGVT